MLLIYVVKIGGHASRGKGKGSSSRDGDNKQQLTFSQSELLVSMDTGDVTNRSFMLPATPPSKKVRSLVVTSYHLTIFSLSLISTRTTGRIFLCHFQ